MASSSWFERQIADREWFDQYYQHSDYPRHSTHDRAFVHVLASKFNLKPGGQLLDLGCGLGWFSYLFSKAGFQVTGVDASVVGVEGARKNYYTGEINWLVGDALNLEFNAHFDVMYTGNFSPFTVRDSENEKHAAVIAQQIMHYLKPGGMFIFVWNSRLDESDPTGEWVNYSVRQIRDNFGGLEDARLLGTYATHPQLCTLLGQYALSGPVTSLTNLGVKFHTRTARIVAAVQKN
ncbi:MAG: class I SAM-dependent methyltransferase [Chloroflexi bacterium]|nr:MAG: class I SAM-dependent methyltransferase [Chloroflexota bacterium]MBL1193275.1 class I SAM-dependent methyltransferase [Chloroflexota bacterium]NOH10567.1 methyltransferase domain-containing protein [Chloroflexota bacterium]